MSKFNRGTFPPSRLATSPLTNASRVPDTVTHEGGAAYSRTPRTELFLACATSFVAEDGFYEKGEDRLDRVRSLVATIATEGDGPEWLYSFTAWLRGEGHVRTAAVVVAAETIRALSTAKIDTSSDGSGRSVARRIVEAACRRADEPGELLGYWLSHYGRPIPNALRRGLADVASWLYTEHATLKYDTDKAAVRFGDVVALCRPTPPVGLEPLFKHLIERRHSAWDGTVDLEALPVIAARRALESVPVSERRGLLLNDPGARLAMAGATWEYVSGWLADGHGMDAAAWEAVIPSMGYMALLRNLRNFDKAGVSDEVAERVAVQLADPDLVARSRQFPFRFFSAYRATESDRWKHPLGKALELSLANLPTLSGRTLVMIDTSASMTQTLSGRSTVSCVEVAALFGVALAGRNKKNADVYGFADHEFRYRPVSEASTLRQVSEFVSLVGRAGHGTEIQASTNAAFAQRGDYARVIIISDMQSFGSGWSPWKSSNGFDIPENIPMYAFDLAGHRAGVVDTGAPNRFQLGGLGDSTFRLIPLLEQGARTGWPWEVPA